MTVEIDKDKLSEDFAWKVLLAKLPNEEAAKAFAVKEFHRARRWVASADERPGSFLWCCDFFDLEPSAVRRAIKEARK